jgi:hypothetical protein
MKIKDFIDLKTERPFSLKIKTKDGEGALKVNTEDFKKLLNRKSSIITIKNIAEKTGVVLETIYKNLVFFEISFSTKKYSFQIRRTEIKEKIPVTKIEVILVKGEETPIINNIVTEEIKKDTEENKINTEVLDKRFSEFIAFCGI